MAPIAAIFVREAMHRHLWAATSPREHARVPTRLAGAFRTLAERRRQH
jgi:hypothetical protein